MKTTARAEKIFAPSQAALRVLLLNTKDAVANPNSYMTFAAAEGLRAHLGRDHVKIVTNENVVEEACQRRPDALICLDGEEVRFDTVLEIKKMEIPVIGWLTEDPYELPVNLQNQDLYDVVFTNERSAAAKYRQGKATFLPFAASRTLCYYPVRDSCRYDVCIAGTAWPERVEWCRKLREEVPDLRWKFILHRAQKEVPKYAFQEPLVQTDYRLSIGDICRVFNQSRIVVSLKREFSGWNPQLGLSPAPRVFETALSGTAQLIQTATNDEIAEFFELGKEIETFDSVKECAEKINTILDDETRRKSIALKGQERVLRDHLYANRVGPIIEWINSQNRAAPTLMKPARRLLVCVHSSTQSGAWGGVEVLTEQLVEHLKSSWSVFLLYPQERHARRIWRLVDINTGRVEEEYVSTLHEAATFAPRESARFKRILLGKQISLVHFQHLIGFPLELPLAAAELGIPYTMTWGDYYPVCHKFTLLDMTGFYCSPDKIPIETCDVCLNATHGYMPGSQLARRAVMSRVMLRSRSIICLSHMQREIITRLFPEVADRIQVIEPLNADLQVTNIEPTEPPDTGPLNVAVTGNFARQKGADTAAYVMKYYQNSPEIHFHVLGRVDPEYDGILATVGLKSGSNVHILGGYKPSQRYSIFRGIHVALFLSIWPEGYPMTLEDLKKARVPCVATDMGEIGRQITHGINGWKVPPHDAGSVISILNSLKEDRSILRPIRANLKETVVPKASYPESMRVLFEQVLLEQHARATNRNLTLKQTKWLGEKMRSYPAEAAIWANRGPVFPLAQQTIPQSSPALYAIVTPREALRRFVLFVKQRGVIGAIKVLLEWLTK